MSSGALCTALHLGPPPLLRLLGQPQTAHHHHILIYVRQQLVRLRSAFRMLFSHFNVTPKGPLPPCARPLRPVRIHTTNAQPCNTRRSLNIRLHVAVLLRRVRAPPPLTVPLRCTLCFNYCHTNKLRHCLSSTISTSISPVQLHTPLRRAQQRQRQSIVFRSARRRRRPRQQHAIFSNEE